MFYNKQVLGEQVAAGEMPTRAPAAAGCRHNATQLSPFLHRIFYTGCWFSVPPLPPLTHHRET